MDEEELQHWKKKFEEMGIRFICENQSRVGPQVGGFLETTIDNQGRIWHAIDGSVPDNLKATLREVLIWVASKGL